MESTVRKLAKGNKYQTIYTLAKEGSVPLFVNSGDYTNIQILFINYLSFYNAIYTDLAMDYVSEAVLDDEIYEDAYIYYKTKTRMKDVTDGFTKRQKQNSPIEKDTISKNSFTWVMKKKTNG